jgi:hypothetical protein
VRRFLFENSLSLFFGAIFLVTIVAQSFAGQRAYNSDQAAHGEPAVGWLDYVLSPDFGGAVMENWQSEFLQFTLFILATVWLVQKGSAESKRPGDAGAAGQRSHGWLRDNSLVLAMSTIFLLTWFSQSLNNWRLANRELREHDRQAIAWGEYVLGADFWERTLQNWQSEFLAVGTMAVFTIYLRQRGSPESKPVGAPHDETASSG